VCVCVCVCVYVCVCWCVCVCVCIVCTCTCVCAYVLVYVCVCIWDSSGVKPWLMTFITHPYAWHDSFISVTWLIHILDLTHAHVWNDSFTLCVCVCVCRWFEWSSTLRSFLFNRSHIWTSHVTHTNESWHTYKRVRKHISMKESWHTYERVMAHI